MSITFKVGDEVSWNSEARRVSGTIIKIHTGDFDYKGYTHHATEEDPQHEIKSDKSDHIAAHKGSALTKLSDIWRIRLKFMKIKRIYEKPESEDGYRILVDRLWPRGISKEEAALDELG